MNKQYWISAVDTAISDLYRNVQLLKDDNLSVQELSEILVAISNMKSDIQLILDDMSKIVAKAMDEDMLTLGDGTSIERRDSSARKAWKHKDLAEAVSERIQRMAVDMDTGEVLLSSRQMMEKMLDYLQPSYWRVGALNSIGINADNFCEVSEPKETIVIRKAKK